MNVSKLINYLFDEHLLKWPPYYYYYDIPQKSENKPKLRQEMWCEVQRKSGFTQQTITT